MKLKTTTNQLDLRTQMDSTTSVVNPRHNKNDKMRQRQTRSICRNPHLSMSMSRAGNKKNNQRVPGPLPFEFQGSSLNSKGPDFTQNVNQFCNHSISNKKKRISNTIQ